MGESAQVQHRLHSVYAALDSNNHARALKALQHRSLKGNALASALKAHALERSGRPAEALAVLRDELLGYLRIAGGDDDDELSVFAARGSADEDDVDGSLVRELDRRRSTRDGAFRFVEDVDGAAEGVLTDETVLATVAVTLSALRADRAAARMYASAAARDPRLHDAAYHAASTLSLSVETPSPALWDALRASSMAVARTDKRGFARAAATALRQWRATTDDDGNDRLRALLPRLARGLVERVVLDEGAPCSAHDWRLYADVAGVQGAQREALERLDAHETTAPLTPRARLELSAGLARGCGDHERAFACRAELLRRHAPDDWEHGVRALESAGELENGADLVQELLTELRTDHPELRGPRLLDMEWTRLRGENEGNTTSTLQRKIVDYVEFFGAKASCCFADVRPYLTVLLDGAPDKAATGKELLLWCQNLRSDPSTIENDPSWTTKLRAYVVACKIAVEVFSKLPRDDDNNQILNNVDDLVPRVDDMMAQWERSVSIYEARRGEERQAEELPGDDLAILSACVLLLEGFSPPACVTALALLERAADASPHNPRLILLSMALYAELRAGHVVKDLFDKLDVKQIQLDSLSYLVLPVLDDPVATAELCGRILDLHRSHARTAPDHLRRSVDNGFWEVARDVADFTTVSMRRSLQLAEAKARVLDAAPFVPAGDGLGAAHGLVGGPRDVARAVRMVEDARDRFGAPDVVRSVREPDFRTTLSDNRDRSVLDFVVGVDLSFLCPDAADVAAFAAERGRVHGILVRAALAAARAPTRRRRRKPRDATPKLSPCAEERLSSLEEAVAECDAFLAPASPPWWRIAKGLCAVVAYACRLADPDDDATTTVGSATLEEVATAARAESSAALRDDDDDGRPAFRARVARRSARVRLVPSFALLETARRALATRGRTRPRFPEAEALATVDAEFARWIGVLEDATRTDDATRLDDDDDLSNDDAPEWTRTAAARERAAAVRRRVAESHERSRRTVLPALDHMLRTIRGTNDTTPTTTNNNNNNEREGGRLRTN